VIIMEFSVAVLLFLLAGLPVFLLGVLLLEVPLLAMIRRKIEFSEGFKNMHRQSIAFDVLGLIVTFLTAYYWWGGFAYHATLASFFEGAIPHIELLLAIVFMIGFVAFFRAYRGFRRELKEESM
jgi:hypothetical protein